MYQIREFTPPDLESVIRINRECLPENYPVYFFKLHHERFPKAFLVAEANERVVGYIMCRVEHGTLHTRPQGKLMGRRGHIISIAVVPDMRGRGIGKNLMIRAMEALRDYYKVDEYYLEVRVSNHVAINLYKKLGFEVVKTIKGYYLDGEDAYLMARPTLE